MTVDVLGEPYEARTLRFPDDYEGEVVATLVRRPCSEPSNRAVLYVHGFVDYFFQTWLADWYVERGFNFYALDLRKCGRSTLPHQTPHFCRDLSEYFAEIDEAVRIIREEDDNSVLLLNAHSTGGLTASLWAHRVRDQGVVDGMFLNSPFFDLNASRLLRVVAGPVIDALGARRPNMTLPFKLTDLYARSIHSSANGEWDFDLTWKPIVPWPVRSGWLRAIRLGHRQLHQGLDIRCPVLVMCSAESSRPKTWDEVLLRTDSVLDVAQIARWTPNLGRHVTLIRIEGAVHDLVLSAAPVREKVFAELDRWVYAHLPKS